MLETLNSAYEEYHNVTITAGARHAAAHLSEREIDYQGAAAARPRPACRPACLPPGRP
eukprot:SAG25_NODE_3992_length_911_cov_0.815271_2_plen_57_part_01